MLISKFKAFGIGFTSFFLLLFSIFIVNGAFHQDKMQQDPELSSAVEWAAKNNLTKYENVKVFRPADIITREQAAKFFVSFAKNSLGKEFSENNKCDFDDIDSADSTLKDYILQACKMGIIKGYEGKFMPKQPLTKPQAITILVRAVDGVKDESITPWYKDYYQWASNYGITNQSLEYIVHNASRYEVLLMLYRSRNGISKDSIQKQEYDMQNYKSVSASSKIMNLSFSSPMDRGSVEKNLKIYPEVNKSLEWKNDKELAIKIDQSFTGDQKIVINVSKDAETNTGKKLGRTKVEYFKVGAQPQISFVSPEGKINDLTKNITVRFNKPIVPLTNLDNQRKCPLEITPDLPGKCVWITTSTFQFRPEGGFPIGAQYDLSIPEGIEAIVGSKTQNSKKFEILTPDFKIVSQPQEIKKDQKLILSFNANVKLEEFKKSFSMKDFSNSELDVQYFQEENNIGKMEDKKDTITVFPKNGDWGYNNKYSYTISDALTSQRGNIGLKNNVSTSFKTNKLLTSYNPFVYKDNSLEHKRQSQNMYKSDDKNIIKSQNPKILLNFHEEISLNKNLFSVNADFELKYEENYNCNDGTCEWEKDKKSIIMEVNGNVDNLKIQIKASQISSSDDISLSFQTKSKNQVKGFNFVDYDKFCMDFKYPIRNQSKYFEFNKYGNVNYMRRIDNSSYYNGPCEKKDGTITYEVSTRINPDSDYTLTVQKALLDNNNYQLDKNYEYSFTTNSAKNEDKNLNLFDSRRFIITPEYISPLGVAIKTLNLDKVKAKVCQGGFDFNNDDFMLEPECGEKVVSINNLGFRTNFSVLNLSDVLGKDIDKKFVTFTVSKLDEDKTEAEKQNNSKGKTSFIRTDKNVVFKTTRKENLLWLTNFHNGTSIDGEISSIKNYEQKSKYNMFGKYQGREVVYKSDLDFSLQSNGVYEVQGQPDDYLLITLKSGEQIIATPGQFYGNDRKTTYIKTDRPIYKPGDTVHIKGVSRILTPTHYNINSGEEKISIRTPKHKEALQQKVNLSDMGTFELDWQIPKDSSLGNYSISMPGGSYQIAVEEYEKPDFELNLEKEKDFFLYGQKAKIDVLADYYIGSPLKNGEGNYDITAKRWYFDGGKTKGYLWGDNSEYYGFYHFPQPEEQQTIARNKDFVLDKNGKKTLNIDLKNPTGENAKNYRYNFSTTVKDPNTKKGVSKSASFKVSKTDIFVGMKFDKYYYDYGDQVSMDFVTVDKDGNKLSNKDIKLKISKLTYEQDPETFEYKEKQEILEEKSLKTDGQGKASFDYNLSDYGKIKFSISLESGKYTTSKSIYVSGRDLLRPKDEKHELNILQNKEKYDVGETAEFVLQSNWTGVKALVTVEKLGEVLKWDVVNINSPSYKYSLNISKEYLPNFYVNAFILKDVEKSKQTLKELESLRVKMNQLEQELLNNTGVSVVPRPIIFYDITYRNGIIPPVPDPNQNLDEELLKQLADYRKQEQDLMQKIMPDWQEGQKKVEMNLDYVDLSADVDTDKDKYLPGDSSTITLNVTDDQGNPVNGEAMIAVVDKAVLALKSDDRNILDYFYSNVSEGVRNFFSVSNLIKRLEFLPSEDIQDDAGFGRGGGGPVYSNSVGGMQKKEMMMEDSADMAKSQDSEKKGDENIRTDFKDSAFYKGVVLVDNGKATIQIPKLPDNLTTWVAQGFVVTSNTKVGEFETEFKTRKKLSLIPSVPRFLMAGDKTQMTAVAVNNTASDLTVTATIDYTDKQPISVKNPVKTVTVKPNSQKSLDWEVEVSSFGNETDRDNAEAEFTISLSAGNLKDGVEFTRDVKPYSTPEYVFTNGNTETSKSYAEKIVLPKYVERNLGKIDIQIGSNILTNLTDSINNIASMPSNNLYRTLDALGKGAILKNLYSSIKEEEKFYEIKVEDYNGNIHKLDDVIKKRKNGFVKFQQQDGGMSYYQDCVPTSHTECSNFGLTLEFLATVKRMEKVGYDVDNNVVKKALSYTKQTLKSKIKKYEQEHSGTYRKIEPFYILKDFDEDFVLQYVPSHRFDQDYGFSNIEKLKIIGVLQELDSHQSLINDFMKDLKNSTLIEARGTLLPADYNSFEYRGNYSQNVKSTALALKIFTNEGESEKLLIENFARWLMAQKEEDGDFGGNSTEFVLSSIIDYIKFTGEFDNIDFTAQGFLNGNEIIIGTFTMDNKFEVEKENFSLSKYLEFGKDKENILGFEKSGNGKLYYDVGMKYFLPIEEIAPRDEGLVISRKYYDYQEYNEAFEKECYWPVYRYYGGGYGGGYNNCRMVKKKEIEPVNSVKRGDYVVGVVKVVVPHTRNNVVVNNYIPAGAKLLNTNLDITSSNVKDVSGQSGNGWGGFNHIEYQKDRLFMFARRLTKGTYKFTYVMNTRNAGKYHNRPAVVKLLEKPEIWGRTAGSYFHINE